MKHRAASFGLSAFAIVLFYSSAQAQQASTTVEALIEAQAAAIGRATPLSTAEIQAFQALSDDERSVVIKYVGISRMTAGGVMQEFLPIYRDAKRQKAALDVKWALHYLSKADPTDPNFNEGLVRLFQQFPAAKDSPEVIRTVNLLRGLAAGKNGDKSAPEPLPVPPDKPRAEITAQLVNAQMVKQRWITELMPGGKLRQTLPAGLHPNEARNAISRGAYDLDAEAAALDWNGKIYSRNGLSGEAQKCLTELQIIQQRIQIRETQNQTEELRAISNALRNGIIIWR